jgi:SAM-dependent methyltransferase
VEIIGSLVPMKAPRVLEIRSRLGTIPAALKRLYGAESYAMAIFENQQFLIQEVYDIPTAWPIDFERFHIPFEGSFDLIVANHMVTHAIHPGNFLNELHSRLKPGGHLYLYHETDEGDFLERGKSMFNNLNPFHVQAFNTASMVRALAIHGFATKFITIHDGTYVCLARAEEGPVSWTPQSDAERASREAAYRQAYETAVLRMPEYARWQVADEWEGIVRRALESGAATITKQGEVKLLRKQ